MSQGKRYLKQYQSINNGDMSQSSITSAVTNINILDNIGIQLEWTGSPVGTFQVQVSNDYNQDTSSPPNVQNAGNWVPLTLSPNPTTAAGSPIYIAITELPAPWIRVVYTKGSGSGTLQAWISAKGL